MNESHSEPYNLDDETDRLNHILRQKWFDEDEYRDIPDDIKAALKRAYEAGMEAGTDREFKAWSHAMDYDNEHQ